MARYRKTHIEPHAGGFRYKRRVPTDLLQAVGRTVWQAWLGTNREAAHVKGAALAMEHTGLIDGLRRLRDNDTAAYARIVAAGGHTVWKHRSTAEKKGAEIGAKVLAYVAEAGIHSRSDDPLTVAADDLKTGAEAKASLLALQTSLAQTQRSERIISGKPDDDGALFELCDLWERVRNPRSAKERARVRLYVRRFIAHAGDLKPRAVTRDHANAFRDKLENDGETSTNIQQHLNKLRTLFNVALSEGVVTDNNPFYKVNARRDNKKHSDKKQSFTAEQARAFIQTLKAEDDDFAWAMKLLVYHGARGKEICQLRVDDVTTISGVSVFRIHDQHGSVKTESSVRDVPVNPRCKGITAYAKRVAAEHGDDAWLFQSFKGLEHRIQGKGSRFLRKKVGITDKRLTIHCWRHTFRTVARNVEMPLSVSHAIMGHEEGGEHGKYGNRPSIKLCAKWIAKVDPLKG